MIILLKPSFLSEEYLVSDDGYVLNKKRTKKLKGSLNHKGYVILNLMIEGHRIGVAEHTLVARAFCEGYKEGLEVNHKNGIHTDNRASNLEWVTSLENVEHSINVLGFNKIGKNNPNARKIYGYDKYTGNLVYEFDSIMDACRELYPNTEYNKLRHIQCLIYKVAKGLKKSYKDIIWKYQKDI